MTVETVNTHEEESSQNMNGGAVVETPAYPVEEAWTPPQPYSTIGESYPFPSYSKKFEKMGFNTRAIHVGNPPEATTRSINPPIYMSSTFSLHNPSANQGYTYTRDKNPSFATPEQQIAALEGAKYGLVFGSGISSIVSLGLDLKPGDCVVTFTSCYSGTFHFLHNYVSQYKVQLILVKIEDMEGLKQTLEEKKPKYMFFESPTNPRMDCCDITMVCEMCKAVGCVTVFDNTFSTPYIQNPLEYGVDAVVHSSTKYLNGHSDILSGVLVTNNPDVYNTALFTRKSLGLLPSPFDAWLLGRSIKTLAVRVQKHSENALAFAKHFESHPHINQVFYPGLETHKFHQLAKKQMKNGAHGFGGMMSVDIKVKGLKQVYTFLENLHIFATAISLGGVESLVNHSTLMTHKIVPSDIKNEVGITDTLIRVSIGIENVEDLIEDFEQALKAATSN